MTRLGRARLSGGLGAAMALFLALAPVAARAGPSPGASAAPTPCVAGSSSEASSRPDRPGVAPTVAVAAASDLRYAMEDLVAEYETRHPDEAVQVTYGSSGNFVAQVTQGAPFDVLFSADIAYPRELEEAGLAAVGSTRTYAEGRIVVWARNDSPLDVERLGLFAVLDAGVGRVAIANPRHAPYGQAAQAAMEAVGMWEAVQPRLVLGENVSQAAQFVESGAADVGVIALSLAIAAPLCLEGRHALVPRELHPPIEQGAVVLAAAADSDAAARLLDFVLGPDGRAVLDRYGFRLPGT
jgi:molybdate transport system substrate-binding protein